MQIFFVSVRKKREIYLRMYEKSGTFAIGFINENYELHANGTIRCA